VGVSLAPFILGETSDLREATIDGSARACGRRSTHRHPCGGIIVGDVH
jgi:hypothetical protein